MADSKAGPSPDDIMAATAMKPLVAKAKQESVSCAIALTDGKLGVVLLHAKMKPKKLLSELRKTAKDKKVLLEQASLRFGTATADPEDSSALIMTINKAPVGGMDAKLRTQMKGSGCAKVVFVVDESLNDAPEDEIEGTVATPPPDPAALHATLAQLMQQIAKAANGDAARQQALVKLAAAANAALKGGDVGVASAAIDGLREALGGATAPVAPATAGAVAYGKARLAWLATRQRITTDLAKLRAELQAEYREEEDGTEILRAYDSHVEPIMAALDERLADKLDEATNAADPATRAALVAEARQLIATYQQFLAAEPLIKDLDDNPFVPLNLEKLVSGTLTALSATVR
jgi:hypothetical protein